MPLPIRAPRLELARLPTPVDHLDALSAEFGVDLHVKRDDLTGAALSGSKVRKLEYLLPSALEIEADVVLTCGLLESNHARTVAVAARHQGLEVELFLRDLTPASPPGGNLLLDRLMGCVLHPLDQDSWPERENTMQARAEELEALGRRAFVIPEGGSNALGALGHVRCMAEIREEEQRLGRPFDLIVTAVGSGGTLAGLVAGAELLGCSSRIVGVPARDDVPTQVERTNRILDELRATQVPHLKALVGPEHFLESRTPPAAGTVTDQELERIRDVAILTGLVLDPIYTNKAFGGLLQLLRDGDIRPGSAVLFLHTGGLFGLFPFAERLKNLRVSS